MAGCVVGIVTSDALLLVHSAGGHDSNTSKTMTAYVVGIVTSDAMKSGSTCHVLQGGEDP